MCVVDGGVIDVTVSFVSLSMLLGAAIILELLGHRGAEESTRLAAR